MLFREKKYVVERLHNSMLNVEVKGKRKCCIIAKMAYSSSRLLAEKSSLNRMQ